MERQKSIIKGFLLAAKRLVLDFEEPIQKGSGSADHGNKE